MDHYWTRQRAIDATVAFVALAATELGRGYYQPVIVAHRIDDLHLADTLAAAD